MSLLERVATLIRANLNDLIDRAEDPEKMIKQVILDMQNQLIQVKTQVAIAIADQHVLRMKLQENDEAALEWLNKAEVAVEKKQDELSSSCAGPRAQLQADVREVSAAASGSFDAGRESQDCAAEAGTEAHRGEEPE